MDTIEPLLTSITTWKSGNAQAIHKPLLLLYALGKYKQGRERLIPFQEVNRDLAALLQKYGNTNPKPYYPFWRLRNDGIWEVEPTEQIRTTNQGDAWITDLEKFKARGGLTTHIHATLIANPKLIDNVALAILNKFFPQSLHFQILSDVGLTI